MARLQQHRTARRRRRRRRDRRAQARSAGAGRGRAVGERRSGSRDGTPLAAALRHQHGCRVRERRVRAAARAPLARRPARRSPSGCAQPRAGRCRERPRARRARIARWRSTLGCGLVDAYAARARAAPNRTVTPVRAAGASHPTDGTSPCARRCGPGARRGVSRFAFERAPDAGGVPGAFAAVDSLPAAGPRDARRAGERHRVRPTPGPCRRRERGVRLLVSRRLHRGRRAALRARPCAFTSPARPAPWRRSQLTLVHDALDGDIEASVRARSPNGPVFRAAGQRRAPCRPTGWTVRASPATQAWTFRIARARRARRCVPAAERADARGRSRSPTAARSRTAVASNDFRLTVASRPAATRCSPGGPLPQQTPGGRRDPGAHPDRRPPAWTAPDRARGLRVAPNPARSGRPLRLTLPAEAGERGTGVRRSRERVARVALSRNVDRLAGRLGARGTPVARPAARRFTCVRGRAGRGSRVVLLGP